MSTRCSTTYSDTPPSSDLPVTYYTLALCASKGAFEAVPRPKLAVDLGAAKARLTAAGIGVTDARVMLIAAMEREVTLSRDGRVLIKSRDAAEAERVFAELRRVVGLPDTAEKSSPAGEG
ncbi:MAG: hypothetical protein L3K16_05570 [Thermoplasmata archaeon]|nr:hypothetical protein [Thermoplasmata archaeon]